MKTACLLSIIGVMTVATFCGCVTSQVQRPAPAPPTIEKFNPDDLIPFRGTGSANVRGQAFLKTRGGEVKIGAGNEVSLIPATPFMREVVPFMQINVEPATYTKEVRSAMNAVIRRTTADAQGNFDFPSVPAGDYILQVIIEWEVAGQYGLRKTGGKIFKVIKLSDGDNPRVMLTE